MVESGIKHHNPKKKSAVIICYVGPCDHMVVGFITTYMQTVPFTTKVASSNPIHVEVYSIQHYVIKIVSDLRQVGGFLQFPPPIKLTTTI